MKVIPLTQGMVALVDDEVYDSVSQFKWCYRAERKGKSGGYAMRNVYLGKGKSTPRYLHKEVMRNDDPDKRVIFLNHDQLDCRKENLKVVDLKEANRHNRVRKDSKSGVQGVRETDEGRWMAYMIRDGSHHYVGTYSTKEAAARAREEAIADYEKWEKKKSGG